MANRVSGGGIAKNPFGPTWAQGNGEAGSVGDQVQDRLFGGRKPRPVEEDADTAPLMARLHVFRKKLARLANDPEDDYDLVLAEGDGAHIDDSGLVYIGRSFLLDYAASVETQVGLLAHEIGHRPKRWDEYKSRRPVSKAEAEDLCRLEETRADYFAGFALAQLGFSYEPLCDFLRVAETKPHPEYLAAPLRAKTIREAFETAKRNVDNRRKFFPEFARMTSAETDLGHA